MKRMKWLKIVLMSWMLVLPVGAHSVKQLFFELTEAGEDWELISTFDAGFSLPEMREDKSATQPKREWLVNLSADETERLLRETEKYLREAVYFTHGDHEVPFEVDFPDFNCDPPSFPELLNGGAYLTVKLTGKIPPGPAGEFKMHVRPSVQPIFLVAAGDKGEGAIIEVNPGDSAAIFSTSEIVAGKETKVDYAEGGGVKNMLVIGYLHVLPMGLDHVLFILALFFMARDFSALLKQSLAFTVAHSITLGMAVLGGVEVASTWLGGMIEPLIALSIAVLALENVVRKKPSPSRLSLVFVFGLVHGLGFASSFATVLKQVDGGVWALALANIGVELAQVTILVVAWVLTLRWWRKPIYEKFRIASSLVLAAIGLYWFVQRISG